MSHDRRSVRLRGHAYDGGLYFVTVCTAGRRWLFGRVADGEVRLSDAGRVTHEEWLRTGTVRPDVVLDAFVVMPDHVHLLFGIAGPGESAVPPTGGRGVLQSPLRERRGGSARRPGPSEP